MFSHLTTMLAKKYMLQLQGGGHHFRALPLMFWNMLPYSPSARSKKWNVALYWSIYLMLQTRLLQQMQKSKKKDLSEFSPDVSVSDKWKEASIVSIELDNKYQWNWTKVSCSNAFEHRREYTVPYIPRLPCLTVSHVCSCADFCWHWPGGVVTMGFLGAFKQEAGKAWHSSPDA